MELHFSLNLAFMYWYSEITFSTECILKSLTKELVQATHLCAVEKLVHFSSTKNLVDKTSGDHSSKQFSGEVVAKI